MSRRRIRCFALVVTALLLAGGGWVAWDRLRLMGLTVGCQSDNLSMVARDLREYAEAHEGRFPPLEQIRTVAGGDFPDKCLTCNQSHLPYQWNLRLAGIRLNTPAKRVVAWCPPGSHGRYVGAITVFDGEVRAEALTVHEVRLMLDSDG